MTSEDLLQAAGTGDIVSLARLLDSGCDANAVHAVTGATALFNACSANQADAVGLLLSRGADSNGRITYASPVDGRIDRGVVPLMVAFSMPVVELLLGAGADPRARDDDGRTVLMHLVGIAPPSVFEVLIGAGAEVSARANDGRTAADMAKAKLDWWRRFAPAKNAKHQADLRQILAILG
jgi:ankyrin repeat protein